MYSLYDVYDLGIPQGYTSGEALSVNSLGQAVGYCSGGTSHAFLWENGNKVDLGTLGGQNSVAYAVNDAGSVVGQSDTQLNKFHAFIWSNAGGIMDLGLPGDYSRALGINNQGSVVGIIGHVADIGFLRTAAGIVQDIIPQVQGDGSGAIALNDKDEVVGFDSTPQMGFYGIFWSGGNETELLPPPRWGPSAVNFSGIVTGTRVTGRAFLWQAGAGVELDPLLGDTNSFGRGINDKGVIVGGSFDANGQPSFGRAVIWSAGGVPRRISTCSPPICR